MKGLSDLDRFLFKAKLENQYIPQEYIGNMFHYTSPRGFDSILFGQEEIKLWASRYDCLNDMSEGTIAQKIFTDVCEDLLSTKDISSKFYELVKGCKKNRTTLFHIPKGNEWKPIRGEWESFICSFSKNRDSLAMWNYYSKGSKYEGYNIGLNTKYIKKNLEIKFAPVAVNVNIYPIVYKKSEQKRLIATLLKDLEKHYEDGDETSIRYVVCDYLTKWSLLFKSEYFEHEQEVRVIVDVAQKKIENVIRERPLEIKYRHSCGYMIPYIELDIVKDALTSVTIGPLQCTDVQKEVQKDIMKERLESTGYGHVYVGYSAIPIRY